MIPLFLQRLHLGSDPAFSFLDSFERKIIRLKIRNSVGLKLKSLTVKFYDLCSSK